MVVFMYEAPSFLDSKWRRRLYKAGSPERLLHIAELFRHFQEPFSSGPPFVPFARLYDQIHFFAARAH